MRASALPRCCLCGRRCRRRSLRLRRLLTRLLACRRAWRGRLGATAGGGHRQPAIVEEGVEGVAFERLLLDELLYDEVELVAVLREHLVGALPRALDDVVHLGVDDLGDLIRVVALLLDLPAQEDELVAAAVL